MWTMCEPNVYEGHGGQGLLMTAIHNKIDGSTQGKVRGHACTLTSRRLRCCALLSIRTLSPRSVTRWHCAHTQVRQVDQMYTAHEYLVTVSCDSGPGREDEDMSDQ